MIPTAVAPGWVAEFKTFIMRGNVVDLAVGIVIGAAFTGIVNSLVKDLITPLIGLLLGGVDFSNWFVVLKDPKAAHAATLDAAKAAGEVTLNVGVFLNAIIQFLIVAFAIFWLVKAVSRLQRKQELPVAAATPTEVLLTEIRDSLATRPALKSQAAIS